MSGYRECDSRDFCDQRAEEAANSAQDSARLDFIEKHKTYPWWNFTRWMMNIGEGAKITAKGEGATLRECIDATMKAAGKE